MFQAAFQVNAFQNTGYQTTNPVPEMDMHDGITKEELRRIRALLKKLKKNINIPRYEYGSAGKNKTKKRN